jgi:threonine/homoserine/homoserine lactone efflux protein
MNKREKDNYVVLFKGAKLSRREANKVGLGIIFGVIGIFISIVVGVESKLIASILIFTFAAVGYLVIGNKIFKK